MRLRQEGRAAVAPDAARAIVEAARLRAVLATLSEADQEALRLVGWEELDLAAAAQAMGCSRATMAVRLHRARRRLERALGPAEESWSASHRPASHQQISQETR